MESINIHKAKTHFSSLVERVHEGEEIIIAKSGKPYARLVPLKPEKERIPGRYPGKVPASFFEDLPEEELREWE
ncbi:MAG: type II toxin-antitoxin system prevent-host-death family antitoxin [Spirochaetales bacterium]|nr:type II toxin-antitoxin system prevent-host-death family antitoxin [Spirochaetales bacterium]